MLFVGRCSYYLLHALAIDIVVSSIEQHLHGAAVIVAEYFKYDLAKPEGNYCKEDIAASMPASSLKAIGTHFLL